MAKRRNNGLASGQRVNIMKGILYSYQSYLVGIELVKPLCVVWRSYGKGFLASEKISI